MRKFLALLLISLITVSMVASISTVLADEEDRKNGDHETNDRERHEIEHEEKKERIVFRTDVLTAVFEGRKPKIKFWYTSDTLNRTKFRVDFKEIIEYSGDEVETTNETKILIKENWIQRFEVESVNTWNFSGFQTEYNATGNPVGINASFTANEIKVISKGGGEVEGKLTPATVEFRVHIYQFNVTQKTVGDVTYTVAGGAEVKIDFVVKNWPFKNDGNKLALEVKVEKEIKGETREKHRFEETETEHEEEFVMVGEESGVVQGFFKWLNVSRVKLKNGTEVAVPVKAVSEVEIEVEDGEREEKLKVWLIYQIPTAGIKAKEIDTLEHDPSIGVIKASLPAVVSPVSQIITTYTIAGAVLIALVILGVAVAFTAKGRELLSMRSFSAL